MVQVNGRSHVARILRRFGAASGVIIFILLGTAGPALAHAFLINSSPAPGARLSQTPAAITLTFSEALARQGTSVDLKILDRRPNRPLPVQLSGGNRIVRAELPTGQRGLFEVSWLATSADDGHLTSGTFAFAVGPVNGQLAGPTSSSQGPDPFGTLTNWLAFLGISLALGGLVVGALTDHSVTAAARSVRLGLIIALVGTVIMSLASITGFGRAGRAPPQVIGLDIVAAGFIGLALVARARITRRSPQIVFLGGAILALAGLGHGRANLGSIGWIVEAIHLIAVATWLGALAHFVLRLRRRPGNAENIWPLALAYSRLAVFAIVVLAGSGAFLAASLLPSLGDLWSTGYGRLLVGKTVLLVIALGLAALGRWHGIAARNEGILRRSTPIEFAVLGVVLVLSSVLVGVGPPNPGLNAADLLGAPPLTGTVLRIGGLAGELTVGIALSSQQLELEVYAGNNQLAATNITAGLRSTGHSATVGLSLTSCGPGCATSPLRPTRDTKELVVAASAPGWRGGSFSTAIQWPPPPEDPGLLAKVIASMRSVPTLVVTEVAHTGPYQAAPYTVRMSGKSFISNEPYVAGTNYVRRLAGNERGLNLYLPGDEIWITLWLDTHDQIVREQLINASDELSRTFVYPTG